MKFIRKPAHALAIVLAAVLALGAPTAATAETSADIQAQLNDAMAALDEMNAGIAAAGEALNDTIYALEQTEAKKAETLELVEVKKQELATAQDILAGRVRANYTAGSTSLLSIVLSSSNFEELTSNIYYANKASAQDVAAINAVNDARSQLEEQQKQLEVLQAEQVQLKDQQQAQVDALEEEQAAQQSYVNGLSAELQQKLAEEEAARREAERRAAEEAARAAAEAAARAAEEEAAAAAAEEAAAQEQQSQQQEQSAPTPSYNPPVTPTPSTPSTDDGGSSVGSGARATIVAAAYSQLGVPYVWGGEAPYVGLDCSGLTQYCYGQAGVYIPHSAAGQSGCGRWVSRSQLQAGDLVVWIGGVSSGSGNHVALYIGNDQIIHANGSYVKLDSLSGRSTPTCYVNVLG